jgi:hypothetical protein
VFTARYGLMPYIKRITFRLLKVKCVTFGREGNIAPIALKLAMVYCWMLNNSAVEFVCTCIFIDNYFIKLL